MKARPQLKWLKLLALFLVFLAPADAAYHDDSHRRIGEARKPGPAKWFHDLDDSEAEMAMDEPEGAQLMVNPAMDQPAAHDQFEQPRRGGLDDSDADPFPEYDEFMPGLAESEDEAEEPAAPMHVRAEPAAQNKEEQPQRNAIEVRLYDALGLDAMPTPIKLPPRRKPKN